MISGRLWMPPAVSLTRSSSGGFNEACKQDLMRDGRQCTPCWSVDQTVWKISRHCWRKFFSFLCFFPIRYCFCSIGWICLRCSLFLSILCEFLQEINKVFIYSNLFQTCVLVTFYRRRSRAYSILIPPFHSSHSYIC